MLSAGRRPARGEKKPRDNEEGSHNYEGGSEQPAKKDASLAYSDQFEFGFGWVCVAKAWHIDYVPPAVDAAKLKKELED